jgi:hypothetical protein
MDEGMSYFNVFTMKLDQKDPIAIKKYTNSDILLKKWLPKSMLRFRRLSLQFYSRRKRVCKHCGIDIDLINLRR